MAERNLAVVPNDKVDLVSEERLQLIRDKFANGAPENEFLLFVEVARTVNLDPLKRQIYLIPRPSKDANGNWTKTWTIQTGIDGYRAIADRTKVYAGSDEAIFKESGQMIGDIPRPDAATVTVWKFVQSQRCPFTATARWAEYYQDKSPMWKRMPYNQLSKCAEALALRKAFPEQLSGVYTTDEMEQAGIPVETPSRTTQGATVAPPVQTVTEVVDTETGEIIEVEARSVPMPPEDRLQARSGIAPTENQMKFLHALARDKGLEHDDLHDMAMDRWNKAISEIDRVEMSALIDSLKAAPEFTAKPAPARQTAPMEPLAANDGSFSYTEFWKWARLNGVENPAQFTELTSRSVQGLTPVEMRDVLTTTLASMPKAGTAGADRYTQ